MTPLIYLAGPYRADTKAGIARNIAVARRYAIAFWRAGIAVLSPHLNSAHMDGVAPRELFLAADNRLLRTCDAVLLMPGWRKSEGTKGEVEYAHIWGVPVIEIKEWEATVKRVLKIGRKEVL